MADSGLTPNDWEALQTATKLTREEARLLRAARDDLAEWFAKHQAALALLGDDAFLNEGVLDELDPQLVVLARAGGMMMARDKARGGN